MHTLSTLVLLSLSTAAPALAVQDPVPRSRFLWADADGDGRTDAFVLRPDGSGHFLVGLEDGGFEDRTVALGLGGLGTLREAAWGDVQLDGHLELVLVETAGRARLLAADEGGVFSDVTERAGLPVRGDVVAAEWLDFDGDGAADLMWHTAREELLFRGDGHGRFAVVELGLAILSPPVADPALAPTRDPDPLSATASDAPAAAAHSGEPDAARSGSDDRGRPLESGGRGPSTGRFGTGSGGGISAGTGGPGLAGFECFSRILDQATGNCIGASSIPGLGLLFPLSVELFVDAATGFVGVGTVAPESPLHVEGAVQFGTGHTLTGTFSSILGGESSILDADHSVIVGGRFNTMSSPAHNSTIGGGMSNSIATDIDYFGFAASISGGLGNSIDTGVYGTIGGGATT